MDTPAIRQKYCADYHAHPNYNVLTVKRVLAVDKQQQLVLFVSDHPSLRNHFLCPWYRRDITENGKTFNSCEQYHMYHKANEFGELALANTVMETKYPIEQFALLRPGNIATFDAKHWANKCLEISYRAHKLKFTQHADLRKALLETGEAIIAEATTPEFGGEFWGTGFRMSDARILNPSCWTGQNHLGQILMRIRAEFILQEN